MLTQTYQLTDKQIVLETRQVTAFEGAELNGWPGAPYNHNTHWQPVDTERFTLVAQETIKVGTPVNRNDADYWIEQIKARAVGEGERVGRVKVEVTL